MLLINLHRFFVRLLPASKPYDTRHDDTFYIYRSAPPCGQLPLSILTGYIALPQTGTLHSLDVKRLFAYIVVKRSFIFPKATRQVARGSKLPVFEAEKWPFRNFPEFSGFGIPERTCPRTMMPGHLCGGRA